MAGTVTPWTWIAATEAAITNMEHWGRPEDGPSVYVGDPIGDLSRCGCQGDGTRPRGQVLITAGEVFWAGDSFPAQDQRRGRFGASVYPDPCGGGWAVPITVKYARCRPVSKDGRTLPPAEEVRAFSQKLHADGDAIWKALLCAEPHWKKRIASVVIDGFGPLLELEGDRCAGFEYQFVGRVRDCEPCPAPAPT